MRLTLSFALVTIIVFTASAQKFSPGYYIKSSGDTIRKDISIEINDGYLEKIATPEGLYLTPKDILGFTHNHVNYVVRKVSMDKTPTAGFVMDTVFLEVLSRGKISLLYMVDENDKTHYYIENENGPQELTVRLNNTKDGVAIQRLETYKSVLKGIFPTCTDLFPTIDKTLFTTKAIQSVYGKLYKCRYQESPPAVANAATVKSKPITELGFFAGVSSASAKFTASDNSGNSAAIPNNRLIGRAKFPTSVNLTGGIFVETKFTRKKNLSVRNEVSYLQYEQTSQFFNKDIFGTSGNIATVGASYLKYSLIFRDYLLPNSIVKPFINAGVSPMFNLSTTQNMERIEPGSSTNTPIFKSTKKTTFGYFVGAGVSYKAFAFELRVENADGINTKEVDSNVKTLYFNLSYNIKTFEK